MTSSVISGLLQSNEPSVRFKVLTQVLERKPDSDEVKHLQEEIRISSRVKQLLSERQADGRIPYHPYAKWYGAHWVLATLADIGYPSGDESLIPLRALALHARLTGNEHSQQAAERAAQVFLKRRLFKRQRDGSLISEEFIRLHYPCYWRYDILFGLKVMGEAGWLRDERCREALEVLESKQLADGGFPAEGKCYYRITPRAKTGRSLVDWGGTSATRMNEFVTVDALFVLKASGRLKLSQGF